MRSPYCGQTCRLPIMVATVGIILLLVPHRAVAIDQFSRQYNTSCTTCHIGFPKLNDIGLAFKDAGFQFSEEDASFIATPQKTPQPAGHRRAGQ